MRSGTRRRLLVCALPLVWMVLANRSLQAQSADSTASPLAANSGRLVLKNTQNVDVVIEIRVGIEAACDDRPPLQVVTIKTKRSYGISADQSVCWRLLSGASADAAPTTAWNQEELKVGKDVRRTI